MTKIKTLLSFLPEIFLMAIVLFYWHDTGLRNPVAVGLFLILVQQFVFRQPKIGFVVGCLFIFLSSWMALAWLSDFLKIETWDSRAWNFFYFGVVFCGVLMASSIFTVIKYSQIIHSS